MMKRMIAVTLAVATAFGITSVNAQNVGGSNDYYCSGHETPRLASPLAASKGGGMCHCAVMPKVGQKCSETGGTGTVVQTNTQPPRSSVVVNTTQPRSQVTVTTSENCPPSSTCGYLAEQYRRDAAARVAHPVVQVAQAPVSTGGVIRVFTANATKLELADAFQAGSTSNVLNAPADDVKAKVKQFTGVDLTTADLLKAKSYVECHKDMVMGKRQVGVSKNIKPSGLVSYEFFPVGGLPVMNECPAGVKVFQSENGTSIALSNGMLLAPRSYNGD